MPIYEYRCDDCEALFEVFQKMSDDPLEVCERCGGSLRKVLHPVAIHFKGSGFYTTDYGRGSGKRAAKEAGEAARADTDESREPKAKEKASAGSPADATSGKAAKAKAPASS